MRIKGLLVIWFALLAVLGITMGLTPEARAPFQTWLLQKQAQLQTAQYQAAFQRQLQKDPRPGAGLQLPTVDVQGKPLQWQGMKSLLFVGNGASCVRDRVVKYVQSRPSSATPLVLVAQMSVEEAWTLQGAVGLKAPVVMDADGSLHRAYNVFFTPRWYVVNGEGKLFQKMDRPGLSGGGCCGQ